LRYALGGSRNVPAVKAMLEAQPNDTSSGHVKSINKVISTASAMMDNPYAQSKHQNTYNCYADEALTKTTQCYGASAIGDGAFLHLDDHVNGLATLARMGKAIPRTYILKINDAANHTFYQWKQPKDTQALKPDAAYIVNDMASDWRASYLPGSCSETNCSGFKFHRYNGWKFAVKTGTTNDGYDGLMTSWSTKYAVVSWVGHHSRHVTLNTSMENLTEPLTKGWMQYAHQGLKAENWTQPNTVKSAPAFIVRNHIHFGDIEPSPTNDLYPGWYVGGSGGQNTSATIDKVSGKLATSCTPATAKQFVSNGNAASWNIDIFKGGKSNVGNGSSSSRGSPTSQANDDVHNCSDSPPTITLTAPASCDSSCTITATITQGTHLLTDPQYASYPGTVTFSMSGQTLHTAQVSDSPTTISFVYTPNTSGSGTLTATVTDSVLYSGSDSSTINFSPPPQSGGAITLTLSSHSGGDANLNWTSNGSASYLLCYSGPTNGCTTVGNTNATFHGLIPNSNYSATVNGSGHDSNTVFWKQ
jgi:hypothetical protein